MTTDIEMTKVLNLEKEDLVEVFNNGFVVDMPQGYAAIKIRLYTDEEAGLFPISQVTKALKATACLHPEIKSEIINLCQSVIDALKEE